MIYFTILGAKRTLCVEYFKRNNRIKYMREGNKATDMQIKETLMR